MAERLHQNRKTQFSDFLMKNTIGSQLNFMGKLQWANIIFTEKFHKKKIETARKDVTIA